MTVTSHMVLKFWFEDNGQEQWFAKDPNFDAQIEQLFGEAVHQARDGKLERWVESPRACLALIILIDQFSRNIYRDSPLAWSADAHALAIAKLAIEKGFDDELEPVERAFLYLPFMHSEVLAEQERCVELTHDCAKDGNDFNKSNYEFAIRHRDVIARFGRFPHRNEILGRDSTDDELEFLKDPDASF